METNKLLKRIRHIATILFLIVGVLILSGCMTYAGKDGPYFGRIVDKETRQPLEGVVVVGNWGIAQWGSTTYYDSYETVTDREGNFTIPGQGIQVFSDLTQLQLFILKAGYEDISGYVWNTVGLPLGWDGDRMVIGLRKLSMEERRKRIPGIASGPKSKQHLLINEINKELSETGRSGRINMEEMK